MIQNTRAVVSAVVVSSALICSPAAQSANNQIGDVDADAAATAQNNQPAKASQQQRAKAAHRIRRTRLDTPETSLTEFNVPSSSRRHDSRFADEGSGRRFNIYAASMVGFGIAMVSFMRHISRNF